MDEFLQLLVAGLAVGFRFALLALGFAVVFSATGVLNLAQGGFVLVGAYLTYHFTQRVGLPFALAGALACAACGLLGVVLERVPLRRTVGQPVHVGIMITIGLLIMFQAIVPAVWGYEPLNLGDPWGVKTVSAAGLILAVRDLWTIGFAAIVVAAYFAFSRWTRYGLAIRATALDQEVASAHGISVRRIVAISWAIAGVVGALGGISLASGAGGVDPTIASVAFVALPAIILGGLDSPVGAVVGGLIIGVSQTLTARYQPEYASWLGTNFHVVMPYVVMLLLMRLRPQGLFGTPEPGAAMSQGRGGGRIACSAMAPRLVVGRSARLGFIVLLAAYAAAPFVLSDFLLTVLDYAGIAAVGALGLNLLTGSTGQVSLGHAALVGVGAYVGAVLGSDAGLPLPAWLLGAALIGAVVGGVVGPFALRLGEGYLVLGTLALVFLGEHIYNNWDGLTGGPIGREVIAPASLGIDFDEVRLAGEVLSRAAGWFWLVWGVVALCALAVANILRSRPGRALQAVRDGELAASVIGVDVVRFKVQAFVIASAFAAVAGSLLASFQGHVAPTEWSIFLSIQFMAMIIVGGLGRVAGAVVGALVITGLPRVIESYSDEIPGLVTNASEEGILVVFTLNQVLFGLLIVVFLLFEPRGLVALWDRVVRGRRRWEARPGSATVDTGTT